MATAMAASSFVATTTSVSAVGYDSPYKCYNDFVKNFKYDLNRDYIETAIKQIKSSNEYKNLIGPYSSGEFVSVRKIVGNGSLEKPDTLEVNLTTYSNYYGFQPSYLNLESARIAINVADSFDGNTPLLYEFHYKFDNPDGKKKGDVKKGSLFVNPNVHTTYVDFYSMENRELYFYKTDNIFAKGDVNRDGLINVTDITKVAAHIKGKNILTEDQAFLADVDNNGVVNVTDVTKIAAHIKGKKC